MTRLLILPYLVVAVSVCVAQNSLPPTCSSKVYCQGSLLHTVQTARIFKDSKTFVDLKMIKSENDTLEDFDKLMNETNDNPTREQLQSFVSQHFEEGDELMNWTPTDFNPNPPILDKIKDEKFKKFAKDLVNIWPTLARKMRDEVSLNPDRNSLVYVPNGFIIPGGRFKEIYYWDSYWIIEGLILSGMTETAKGMIENFLHLVKKFGHIPNGSRVYYAERSQPPLLIAMVDKYVKVTKDINWLRDNLATLEEELSFWVTKRTINVTKDDKDYTLLRYFAESRGPRPESYAEDYAYASEIRDETKQQTFFTNLKSAAESGWDFSTRWFFTENSANIGNLSNIHTTKIVPVDLNSMYAGALETMGNFNSMLKDKKSAKKWWTMAEYWRLAIDKVLWDPKDGIWYDYNLETRQPRKGFFPSNVAPLWAKCVEAENLIEYGPKVIEYLKRSTALSFPGGIPTSVSRSGEQWDHPNAWPPLQSMVVEALKHINTDESNRMAQETAQKWVRANYIGYNKTEEMFEKYDAEKPGDYGGGGEYVVQSGFGWTNGVVLEMLNYYGQVITSDEV